ncbi:hypothetical protein ACGF0K_40290 [Streptomyces sp. NPDC048156]|uniref:hypothetical protein n=1 Tax=Streptomyces sp. NPDC048156 TaxID=3365502 RepID=UPI00371A7B2B
MRSLDQAEHRSQGLRGAQGTRWISSSYGSAPRARLALAEQAADGSWVELEAWPDSAA